MKPAVVLLVSALLLPRLAAEEAACAAPPDQDVPAPPQMESSPSWEFSASVMTYIVPDDDNYAQPTVTADRGLLHLEGRYNYEALETGSFWAGVNLAAGDRVAFEFTPMLGGVFGDITGIAPGYEGSIAWWWLELYSEGEYVADLGNSDGSFFYNWSELTLAPVDWFRFGLVTQRTRAYASDREVQRGLLVGVSFWKASLTTYVFNPDDTRPLIVVALGAEF